MEQIITVSCKLNMTPEMATEIDATLVRFAEACEWINANTNPKLTNKNAMQKEVYQTVREKFGLAANSSIQAIRRVCANRLTAKQKGRKVKGFAPTSATYDQRIFSFNEKNWRVSVKLLNLRAKFSLDIGDYQRNLLAGQNPTSATLVKRRNGNYHIDIQVKLDVPSPIPPSPPLEGGKRRGDKGSVLGIDLGRRDIATTSEGESWSGKEIQTKRDHYSRMRAVLQQKASKGTRSSRRRCRQLLKRLAGKEKRFQKHVNHVISRRLVDKAAATGQTIALEDLTGIRERTNQQPRNKTERRRSNSWAFYELRSFLTYKTILKGVELVFVNPAYTSQTCHKCLHIHPVKGKSYRSGKTYKCGHCGWKGDADLNGAKNIAALGLSVSQPGGPYLSCELTCELRCDSAEERAPRQYPVQLSFLDLLEGYLKPLAQRSSEG